MANILAPRLSTARYLALAAAAILVSACASNPKTAQSSTEIIDAPVASAPAPDPAPAEAAPETPTPAESPTETCSLVRVGFAFDSAQLEDSAMQSLRENADCLSRRGATSLLVEGHCDERGTTEYNVALGARRADAVKRYLAALGVTASIDSISFGKEIPIASGSGETAWAQNRRAEMRLPGDRRSDGQLVSGR